MKTKLVALFAALALVALIPATAQALNPTLTLGKPKLNKTKGTAKLPATVNQAGTLVLTGKGVKKVTKIRSSAGTSKLKVKAKGSKLKTLNKTGKVKVKVKVKFTITPPDNYTPSSVTKTKKITLKKNI
jgi:hypothetical protein